jgi:hypothetical protein
MYAEALKYFAAEEPKQLHLSNFKAAHTRSEFFHQNGKSGPGFPNKT